jgi:endo-1,4-beta-xylanase
MISRRDFLVGGLALAAGAAPAAGAATSRTLAEAAAAAGLLYGASVGDEAASDPAYLALYNRETQIVTTDVALKFDWLRPTPERFEFGRADAIVAAAQRAGKLVRGHTLIWNDNAPDWLKRLSAREVERVFDQHIDVVVGRYAGKLHSWDVVNEPFWPMDRQEGGWRDGPWFAAMGPSYVERAFRRVAAIDGNARLTLNEAQCENNHEWGRSIRPPLARLVDDLCQRDVPLHAIGFQSHLQPQWPSDFSEFADYAASFGRKGLDIYLTEFDVNDQSFPDDSAMRAAAVARFGAEFLDATLKIPQVRMVVNWQLSDRYSWYRQVWRRSHPASARSPQPLPFDDDFKPNPLRSAMLAAFRTRAA